MLFLGGDQKPTLLRQREIEVKIIVLKKTRMDVCFLLGANSEWPVIPLGNGKLRRDIIAPPQKSPGKSLLHPSPLITRYSEKM